MVFQQKQGYFAFFVTTAGQLYQETELLHGELHHHPRTVHRVFGLHVDVREKSFQDQKIASISPLCAKLHHPDPKNKKVMKIYSQLSIKSNPLTLIPARSSSSVTRSVAPPDDTY